MIEKHPVGGTPTNTTLWKILQEEKREINFISSMLANIAFIKLCRIHTENGTTPSIAIQIFPIEIELESHPHDIGLDISYRDWGTSGCITELLAYDICKLILGDADTAKLIFLDYVPELALLSQEDDHLLPVVQIKRSLDALIKRFT